VSDAASSSTQLTPAQHRTLTLLRRAEEPVVFDAAFVDDLIRTAAEAVAELSARLQGETLFVSKGFLAKVHGCEVRHLAPDDFAWKPSTAAGFVAHKAIELSLNWRGDRLMAICTSGMPQSSSCRLI